MDELDQLGLHFGTDKASSHHGYLRFYQRFLEEIRQEAKTILEIGVYQGASLRMWSGYFPQAKIIGVDISPECRAVASGRIQIEVADQSNPMELAKLLRHAPFDLVVDDGSHQWNHQITSFRYLYPHVRPGGYYILEDLVTSYGTYVPTYQGISTISTATYLQRMSDYLVGDSVLAGQPEEDAFLRAAAAATEFIAYHKFTSLMRRKGNVQQSFGVQIPL